MELLRLSELQDGAVQAVHFTPLTTPFPILLGLSFASRQAAHMAVT